MSDTVNVLIPSEPFYTPSAEQSDAIKSVISDYATLEILDKMQFADAGSNFESVCCPFCKTSLMDWWCNAMDMAYSDENGFMQLCVTLPCCGKEASLNDLDYMWPQGFYRTKIIVASDKDTLENKADFIDKLKAITGISWRLITAHY